MALYGSDDYASLDKLLQELTNIKKEADNFIKDATKQQLSALDRLAQKTKEIEATRKKLAEERIATVTEAELRAIEELQKKEALINQRQQDSYDLRKQYTGKSGLDQLEKDQILKYWNQRSSFEANLQRQLIAANATADSRTGRAISNRLGAQEQRQRGRDLTSQIPLIGVKLGEMGMTLTETLTSLKNLFTNRTNRYGEEETGAAGVWTSVKNAFKDLTSVLSTISDQIETLTDQIASNQSTVDTRLNGSTVNEQRSGSYWKQISYELSSTMTSPLIKQEDLMNNVIKAVNMGISKDLTSTAMLETIKDDIASTFDAFDSNLRRLIRIQDENTTAARLGMEASLNELLNEMYETTEYLTNLADSVAGSLTEAEALMDADTAVEFEYQVQKWLGSLYSVGMSTSGVSAISTALGQLASGDISGLTSGGASNLLVMAANNAGLSISEILAEGLDASNTNKLLSAMVEYMADLAEESGDSLVVQQQLAKVFGLTASDLEAATNLTGTYSGKTGYVEALETYMLTYESALSNLVDMADSMASRMSLGEMMSNVMSNVTYGTASGIASNVSTYVSTKIADILDTLVSGIPIGYATVAGTGYDSKLTVSDILRSSSLLGGITTSLTSLISSVASGSGAGWTGSSLLKMVGIDTSTGSGGSRTSSSGTVTISNSSLTDMTDSATSSADDESESKLVEAQAESTEVSTSTINTNIVSIYELLEAVVNGTSVFNVKIAEQPVGVANDNDRWAWY